MLQRACGDGRMATPSQRVRFQEPCVLFFAGVETTFPLGWAVVGDLFGRKHYAKIRGYMTLFYTWGGVIGPVLAGAIFDRWGTYEPLLWSLVGVFIVAGLFFASLDRSWRRATGRIGR